ncbi:uncharacterized protein LOC100378479 isoform X2 [Saccoglossus kowalevskii]
MAEISLTSAQIRDGVKEILKHADLTTMSAKKVRRTLEDKYDVDLFDRKKEIDQIVMSTITATTTSESEKESPSKKSNDEELPTKDEDTSLDDKEVDSDSSSLGEVEDEPPKKKIKKQKVKTKPERSKPAKTEKKKSAEIVSDCDSDVESTQNDEEMARKLQEEEENGGRVTRNRNAKRTEPPKPTPKRKPKTERKGKSGYSAEMVLSHELAEIVGTNRWCCELNFFFVPTTWSVRDFIEMLYTNFIKS